MRIPRRLRPLAMGATILALGIAAALWWRASPLPLPLPKVVVATPTNPHSALVLVAFDRGFFGAEGLAVEMQARTYGKEALASMLEGHADFALTADTPLVYAALDNSPIAIIAGIFSTENDPEIIARRDAGIARPEDLAGKRIGVALGTTGEFVMDVILEAHRVPRTSVTAIDIAPKDMFDALAAGKLDAVSIWYPTTLRIRKELGEKVVSFPPGPLYTETFNLVSTRGYVAQNPEIIRRVLKAILRAEDYARENPDRAATIVAAATSADPRALRDLWPGMSLRVALGQSLIINMEDQARWLIRRSANPARPIPNFLDAFHPDALRSVKPEAVAIIR